MVLSQFRCLDFRRSCSAIGSSITAFAGYLWDKLGGERNRDDMGVSVLFLVAAQNVLPKGYVRYALSFVVE